MKKLSFFLGMLVSLIGVVQAQTKTNDNLVTSPSSVGWNETARSAMEGTYSINQDASSGADFNSIDEAISALNAVGIISTVTLELAEGTYTGFIVLSEIIGTDDTKRVIFKGTGANADLVTLTSNAGYTSKPTVNLNGADFITFENLTITTTSTNFTNLVHITNGACNNSFTNVNFIGVDVTIQTLNNDKHLVYSPSSDQLDHGSHFENCRFENGYIALHLTGINAIQPCEQDLKVINCFFTNQYAKSIYTNYVENSLIKQNTIENSNDRKNGYQAMDFFRAGENVIVEQNTINIQFDSNSATGIEFRPGIATSDNPIIVRNNMVRIHSNAGYSYPMIFSNKLTDNVYASHNTCLLEGASSGSGCVFIQDAVVNLNISNNILVNNAGGYVFRMTAPAAAGTQSDFNIVSNSGNNFARLGAAEITSLSEWVTTTSKDNNSRLETIQFVSPTDLHIVSEENVKVTNPLDYVLYDFDGSVRSSTNPCAGADEIVEDQAPVVANQVEDIVFTTFPAQTMVDLTNTFDDPDDDNSLITMAVLSNSNQTDVQAEISGNELTVTRLTANEAAAELVIRATSNGLTVDMMINVTAIKIDQAPVVANQVEDIVFTTFPAQKIVDLTNTFDDPDNDNSLITMAVLSNSNQTEIQAEISGKELTVARLTANDASAELIIRATSNGLTVDMTVNVTAIKIDQAPVVANQVEDVIFTTFPAQTIVDLTNTFDDPDNDNSQITITVLSNSNETDIQATLNGKDLTVSRLTSAEATAEIVIQAFSNGLTVDMSFMVYADLATSVDYYNSSISFFPNPASDNLYISGNIGVNNEFVIYNISGEMVKSGILTSKRLNINDLKSGLYIFRLQESNQTFRFIRK